MFIYQSFNFRGGVGQQGGICSLVVKHSLNGIIIVCSVHDNEFSPLVRLSDSKCSVLSECFDLLSLSCGDVVVDVFRWFVVCCVVCDVSAVEVKTRVFTRGGVKSTRYIKFRRDIRRGRGRIIKKLFKPKPTAIVVCF